MMPSQREWVFCFRVSVVQVSPRLNENLLPPPPLECRCALPCLIYGVALCMLGRHSTSCAVSPAQFLKCNYLFGCVHMSQHVGQSQRTTCGSQLSPSAMWMPVMGLRSSGLTSSTCIHKPFCCPVTPTSPVLIFTYLLLSSGVLGQIGGMSMKNRRHFHLGKNSEARCSWEHLSCRDSGGAPK